MTHFRRTSRGPVIIDVRARYRAAARRLRNTALYALICHPPGRTKGPLIVSSPLTNDNQPNKIVKKNIAFKLTDAPNVGPIDAAIF